MIAAQNSLNLPVGSVLGLVAKALSALPPWLVATVVIVLSVAVATAWAFPHVLRALDDRRVVQKASEQINSEQAALAALRITRPPRRGSVTIGTRRGRAPGPRP